MKFFIIAFFIIDTESLFINDDQTLYLYFIKSICNSSTIITTATRPARPKILFLIKLLQNDEKGENNYWQILYNELNQDERVSILYIHL
jgi:hypothetical protein